MKTGFFNRELQTERLWVGEYPFFDPDPNVSGFFVKTIDGYHAINVVNPSTGLFASADIVAVNNSEFGYVSMGITGTNNADPDYALFGANVAYLNSFESDLYIGSAGMHDTYFFAGGTDSKDHILGVFTCDGKVGFGGDLWDTPPTEFIEFRGSNASMYVTEYGNWILGDKVVYNNIPAMAINMPDGGYGGTNYKNVILMSGTRSNAGSLIDNINMGLFQRTDEVGNYATFNFYNALQLDSGTFGVRFRSHTASPLGDFFLATANGGLPYFRFLALGDGGVVVGQVQDGYGGQIHTTTKGLSVIDHNDDGYIVVSGQSNLVGAMAGIEFNYNKGTGAGNFNVARIAAYTQLGGGGDLLFQTAPQSNLDYITRFTIEKAGDGVFHHNLRIGIGATGIDYTLTFNGENNDGILTWKEDEDYFDFADKVRMPALLFDIGATPSHVEGQVHWNADDKTLDVDTNVSGVALQLGQEMYMRSTNKTGSQIINSKLVYVTGAQGNRPTIALAKANDASSCGVVAMATHDIDDNATGFVTTYGLVRGVNTDPGVFTEGDDLYLSATVDGGYTNVAPTTPNFVKKIGTVVYAHATEGIILVNIDNTNFCEELVFENIALRDENWADDNSAAVSLGTAASAPGLIAINGGTIETRAFDGNATVEQLFWCKEINHDWRVGTAIKPHIHWMPTTNAGGNVKWNLTYAFLQNGNVIGSETTISVVTAAGTTPWAGKRSDFPDIDMTGRVIGTQFYVRLWRDPTDGDDTYPDDAAVATIGIHYQKDTLGSRELNTK